MGEGRICVIRQLGGIGDCLVMSCVYKGLREKYPNHKIQLVTGKYYLGGALYELAERNPYIDEILIIEPNEGTTKWTTEVHRRYFGGAEVIDNNPLLTKADILIDLNCPCAAQEMQELRDHNRVITPRYKIWADHAGVIPSSYFPVYEMKPEDREFAKQKWKQKKFEGKRVVGLNAAACDPRRGMGYGRLEALCQDLQDRGYTPVVIDPTFNFDTRFNALNGLRISELMACVEKMDLVISTDSGVLHMAGTTRVPVIGVFGPTDPDMRMKLYKGEAINGSNLMPCAPCWYGYQCLKDPNQHQHYKCMSKVDPKWIVDKAEEWLNR